MAKNIKRKHKKPSTLNNGNDLPKGTRINKLMLALISLLIIYINFSLPANRDWIQNRIYVYLKEVPHQIATMDVEQRIIERHGYNYIIPKFIYTNVPDSAIVLLPPKSYVQTHFSQDFYRWHHVTWNYYFFGRRNYINFAAQKINDLSNVTHAIICNEQNLQIKEIASSDELETIMTLYEHNIQNPKLATK